MEWLIMPSNNLRMTASKMGFMKDGQYVIGDECEASLGELLRNLQEEDTVSRSSRREIANSKLVEGDLFPILRAAVNDVTITHLAIKVLSNLTLPMAVLMPVKHHMTQQDWEKRRGVQHMESAIKSQVAESQITKILVDHMNNCVEDAGDYTMDKDSVAFVLEILSLLRNVLHTDDIRPGNTNGDLIINNLLDAGFDDVVIDLVARDEGAVWVSHLTQILGLMFRSQKSDQLLEILSNNCSSKKETSHETSQTSPQPSDTDEAKQDAQNNQTSPKLPGIHGYENSKSENGSESGEGLSLSSLCQALQGEARVASSNGESSRSVTPTNEMNDNSTYSSSSCSMDSGSNDGTLDGEDAAMELRKKLSQFALKFAKRGLDRCILLCQADLLKPLEDMCFLWMQNFFLSFASHQSVTYTDIRHTVSSAVLSNLTYLACQTWQDFKMSMGKDRKKGQSNGKFKKLYLVMAVIRQILSQLRHYSEMTLSEEEEKWFLAATETLCCTTNLRLLYPMLIRGFQAKSETVQYLRELVLGNGELLHLFSNVSEKHMENGKDVMLEHFTDFVDTDIVTTYNYLLSSFSQNTLAENEAIFTFYYHLTCDLDAAHMLFQIPVFTNFANIWDAQNPPISQESLDLMDYIILKYTELATENPDDGLNITIGLEIATETAVEAKKMTPTKGKKRKHAETEEEEEETPKKSRAEVLNEVLESQVEVKGLFCLGSSIESSDEEAIKDPGEISANCDTIQDCLQDLRTNGYGPQLKALQTLLLEICYVKLNCPKIYPAEPLVWQYCADKKSVPLFAFTLKSKSVQSLQVFKNLLQKMGLHQAEDSSHLFPSVPAFMTAEMTYAMAKTLGPVDKSMLKFDVTVDMELLQEHVAYTAIHDSWDMADDSLGSDREEGIRNTRPTHSLRAPGAMWQRLIKKANTQMPTIIT